MSRLIWATRAAAAEGFECVSTTITPSDPTKIAALQLRIAAGRANAKYVPPATRSISKRLDAAPADCARAAAALNTACSSRLAPTKPPPSAARRKCRREWRGPNSRVSPAAGKLVIEVGPPSLDRLP